MFSVSPSSPKHENSYQNFSEPNINGLSIFTLGSVPNAKSTFLSITFNLSGLKSQKKKYAQKQKDAGSQAHEDITEYHRHGHPGGGQDDALR